MYWNIVDEKTKRIGDLNNNYIRYIKLKESLNEKSSKEEVEEVENLRKSWIMEIKIVDNVVYFSYNKPISINPSWFPPESFYKFLSTSQDIEYSKLNYCVICVHEWDKNSKIKSKSIFVSNIPHSKQDLKIYSLKDKVFKLNDLEEKSLIELDSHLWKKIELMEQYVTSENINRNWKSSKKSIKKLWELIMRKERLKKVIKQCRLRWLYHWRNWLALLSSSYSSLDDIIKIVTNWSQKS
jgi:hypothetical protein